LIKFVITSFI